MPREKTAGPRARGPKAAAARPRATVVGGDGEAAARYFYPPPEVVIDDAPGMASLRARFTGDMQMLYSEPGAFAYMRGPMEKGAVGLPGGGLGKAVKKALAGQDPFVNRYARTAGAPEGAVGELVLSAPWPGDVVALQLKQGQSMVLSRGSLLAHTDGVTLDAAFRLTGILDVGTEEGFVLPKVTCEAPGGGTVWAAAYGAIRRHDLVLGEKLLVDNGLMLAMPGAVPDFKLVRLGKGWASTLLGGEGLGMQFTGPGEVYTQSKNPRDLAAYLADLGLGGGGGSVGGQVAAGVGVGAALGVMDALAS